MVASVVHVSFSRSGGAGRVAKILTEARNASGGPTSHVYGIDRNLWADPLSAPRHAAAAALDHFVVKSPAFGAPISLLRDSLETANNAELDQADVIHLHSINGQLSLDQISHRWPDKRIVWTLHDMNPMTGACHYSLGCRGYITGCKECPAVRRAFQQRVSVSLDTKRSALEHLKNLQIVAPSPWLADAARESLALSAFPAEVIPNPVDPIFFSVRMPQATRIDFTFVIVAQNLSDPVKNVATAVETFHEVKKLHPDIRLALVGDKGNAFTSDGITSMGLLSSQEIAKLFTRSGTLIVPSLAENSPLVIAEAAARGVNPLVHHVGGMPAMIEALGTGSTFQTQRELYESMCSLAEESGDRNDHRRRTLSDRATDLYSPASVSAHYDTLYSL